MAYVFLTVLGLVALAEWADPRPPLGAGCRIGYVYDGDTVELICGASKGRGRLIGIDTPELEARCPAEHTAALAARRALSGLITAARQIDVRIMGRDKYGRDLVRLDLDGKDAAEAMLGLGHGRRYDGGHRAGWCG